MTEPIRPAPLSDIHSATCSRKPAPDLGSVSRPSVKACSTRSGTSSDAASSISASQVLQARVHAAVGDQADHVHALGRGEGVAQHLVGGQLAVLGGGVDPGQVLHHDAAGAEVEVADLGVAHLPLGQPDGPAAGGQRRRRKRRPQLVEHGRVGERDGVAGAVGGQAPAVEDDQRRARHGQRVARRPRSASVTARRRRRSPRSSRRPATLRRPARRRRRAAPAARPRCRP